MYNYADDNTLAYAAETIDSIVNTLESESKVFIKWFCDNQMHANPDKFQAIATGKKTFDDNLSFAINGNIIQCDKDVLKRIGIHLNKLERLTIYYSLSYQILTMSNGMAFF